MFQVVYMVYCVEVLSISICPPAFLRIFHIACLKFKMLLEYDATSWFEEVKQQIRATVIPRWHNKASGSSQRCELKMWVMSTTEGSAHHFCILSINKSKTTWYTSSKRVKEHYVYISGFIIIIHRDGRSKHKWLTCSLRRLSLVRTQSDPEHAFHTPGQ